MSAATPSDRVLIAQIAANTRWANAEDRAAGTAAARRGDWARWLEKADPEGVLTEQERHDKAKRLQKAHMQRMALKSAQARRAKKAGNS